MWFHFSNKPIKDYTEKINNCYIKSKSNFYGVKFTDDGYNSEGCYWWYEIDVNSNIIIIPDKFYNCPIFYDNNNISNNYFNIDTSFPNALNVNYVYLLDTKSFNLSILEKRNIISNYKELTKDVFSRLDNSYDIITKNVKTIEDNTDKLCSFLSRGGYDSNIVKSTMNKKIPVFNSLDYPVDFTELEKGNIYGIGNTVRWVIKCSLYNEPKLKEFNSVLEGNLGDLFIPHAGSEYYMLLSAEKDYSFVKHISDITFIRWVNAMLPEGYHKNNKSTIKFRHLLENREKSEWYLQYYKDSSYFTDYLLQKRLFHYSPFFDSRIAANKLSIETEILKDMCVNSYKYYERYMDLSCMDKIQNTEEGKVEMHYYKVENLDYYVNALNQVFKKNLINLESYKEQFVIVTKLNSINMDIISNCMKYNYLVKKDKV